MQDQSVSDRHYLRDWTHREGGTRGSWDDVIQYPGLCGMVNYDDDSTQGRTQWDAMCGTLLLFEAFCNLLI